MQIARSTITARYVRLIASRTPDNTYALLGDDLYYGGNPAGEGAVVDEDETADLDGSPRRRLDGRGHGGRFLSSSWSEMRSDDSRIEGPWIDGVAGAW